MAGDGGLNGERVVSPQERADRVGAAMYERDTAARANGIELVSVAPGRARMRMAVRPDMVNGLGLCHGGHIFLLADTCLAYASNAYNAVAVAQTASITFVASGRAGEMLDAEAKERARSGRTRLFDVTVTGGDGRTVALFNGMTRRLKDEVVPGLGIGE